MKQTGIAIIGLGVVGGGAYEIIRDGRAEIARKDGADLCVLKVLEPRAERLDALKVPPELRAASFDEILDDPRISAVIETVGGIEPAKTFIVRALAAGKNAITANKELIAKHREELERAARRGAGLYFEAACAGGIPIVRALELSLRGDAVRQITGIVNGTTNFILTKMSEDNCGYAAALKEAQALGYAEANPGNDTEGWDSVYKLCILAGIAFNTRIPPERVYREGITKITEDDVVCARETGYRIKLLAVGKLNGGVAEARVHPCLVPEEHPLAGVRDNYNAVYLSCERAGDLMFYGMGAGARPAGGAVIGDVVYCARGGGARTPYKPVKNIKFARDFESNYYINITVPDRVGMLARAAGIFGRCGVSIERVFQRKGAAARGSASVVYMTHAVSGRAVARAAAALNRPGDGMRVNSLIPMVSV